MTKATEAVLVDALRLGPAERAELAVELLASLDGPADAVYQKDLGSKTLEAFEALERFDPNKSWSPVETP